MSNFLNIMQQKILLAQDIDELKFILSNKFKDITCLPLNLKTQIYCMANNIRYFDLMELSDNNFHLSIQKETEELINQIEVEYIKESSFKIEFISWIRQRIYSIIFVKTLIDKINQKNKIQEIVVSGWSDFLGINSKKNYYLSFVINNLFKEIKIRNITNSLGQRNKNFLLNYSLKKIKNKKSILVNNLGYNFKRIFFWAKKNNYTIVSPIFEKQNFFKKIIFNFFGIHFIEILGKKSDLNKDQSQINFKKNLKYKANLLSECIFYPEKPIKDIISNYSNLSKALNEMIKNIKPDMVITNISRGIGGCLLEQAKKNEIKSFCIPHGTLSSNYDKNDKLYKKIISDAIVPSSAIKFAVQTKICEKFVQKNDLKNSIITGNLIFSEVKKKSSEIILYAVTQKDFYNMQFYGVETFYEYLDNLDFLDKFSNKLDKKIVVKPHPSEFDSISFLKTRFKNLEFTKEKNEILLQKTAITLSFSSTMIEDSLCSKIPVILLDRWKRYKHCMAETDPNKKDSPVYYINNEADLKKCIDTILKSDKINFENFIFNQSYKNNLDKILKIFLN